MASQGESNIVQLKSTQLATFYMICRGEEKEVQVFVTVVVCVLGPIVHIFHPLSTFYYLAIG